jgi:hypothetical protein
MTENPMAKFGCPLVSDEEIDVAVAALSKNSNHVINGQGARNLAYSVLVALRGAYFDEKRQTIVNA